MRPTLFTAAVISCAVADFGAVSVTGGFTVASAPKWGVNIHFTREPVVGEVAMLSAAYKIVRMDLSWASVETAKGVYDFSAYDALVSEMTASDVAFNNFSPYSDEGIAAFTAFSMAAVRRYATSVAVFEMYNEPNGGFWTPIPNATAYARLALSVGKALRALPTGAAVTFVGPALAGLDPSFFVPSSWLGTVFQSGVLEFFDAVSVHPYRDTAPELALPAFEQLRTFIATYTSRQLAIVSGEWGYSTCVWPCEPPNFTGHIDECAAKYLARQWLANDATRVAVSIWYDWIDDCDNTTMRECMFGTVHADATGNATEPFAPKPAYTAALVLQHLWGDAPAPARLPATTANNALSSVNNPLAFVLQYNSSYAVWNTDGITAPNGSSCTALGDHEDCGFYGISEQQCAARGCCFQDPYQFGPQCFFQVPLGNITFATTVTFSVENTGACFAVSSMFGVKVNTTCASTPANTVSVFVADDSPVYLTVIDKTVL